MKQRGIIIGLFLLILSTFPLFLMEREMIISEKIMQRYEIFHTYYNEYGPSNIDAQSVEVKGIKIELQEIPTGKKAALTVHEQDEGVAAGNIVKMQFMVNGKNILTADEIALTNRDTGSRYFSWLDVLLVKEKKQQTEKIAIVQRLTDNFTYGELQNWKIIWVDLDGEVTEETFTYKERSEHLLGVRLVAYSGISLMSMGYYSDIFHYYPTIFFPIIYPYVTAILGGIFVLYSLIRGWIRKKQGVV